MIRPFSKDVSFGDNHKRVVTSVKYVFVLLVAFDIFMPVLAGHCWTHISRNGKCYELLKLNTTQSDCCSSGSATTAYSELSLDHSNLFYWRIIAGGVPCTLCKNTCDGVKCDDGKKCMKRKNGTRCVCSPKCNRRSLKGPVCGSDGVTYRNLCQLRKLSCRRQKNHNLSLEYFGKCQAASCAQVRCPSDKQCLLDQNLLPHCVRCFKNCSNDESMNKHLCGVDGVTYPSTCHLQQAACQQGRAIPIAYRGWCKPSATCSTIHCKEDQVCLEDVERNQPRCVTCIDRCSRMRVTLDANGEYVTDGNENKTSGIVDTDMSFVCGTNNQTYTSWCHMLKDACASGFVIDTKYPGKCKKGFTSSRQNDLISIDTFS